MSVVMVLFHISQAFFKQLKNCRATCTLTQKNLIIRFWILSTMLRNALGLNLNVRNFAYLITNQAEYKKHSKERHIVANHRWLITFLKMLGTNCWKRSVYYNAVHHHYLPSAQDCRPNTMLHWKLLAFIYFGTGIEGSQEGVMPSNVGLCL